MRYISSCEKTGSSDNLITILHCGCTFDSEMPLHTFRPDGLEDFQLIYVAQGAMNFNISGSITKIGAGGGIIFRPGEPQDYECDTAFSTTYYWVHFAGSEAERLINQCGLDGVRFYRCSDGEKIYEYYKEIIDELTSQYAGHTVKSHAALMNLLVTVSRGGQKEDSSRKNLKKITPALNAIIQHPGGGTTNSEYAKMCGLTPYYFIRLFKSVTGSTPNEYKTRMIMEKSSRLLFETDCSITEISHLMGFDDPLYFGKKFKKHFGVSPSIYRETNHK